jgi:ion channel-forming bestrophin family protein
MSTFSIDEVNRREKRDWFGLLLQFRGSVLAATLPRVLVCSVFSLIISFLFSLGFPVSLPFLSNLVPSLVLGLLLVFRTNTAYDRYWEGRKSWGGISNTSRNLASQIWVAVSADTPNEMREKKQILHCIVAFAIATKTLLRSQPVDRDILRLIPEQWQDTIQRASNPPLEISLIVRDYLQQQQRRDALSIYHVTEMFKLIDTMIDNVGACDRILKTPVPLAYSIHLKQLLMLYCFSIPISIVKDLHWATFLVSGLVSFTVLGIEEIGIEIENPFGYDLNDLPLDTICLALERSIEDIIEFPQS